MSTWRLSSIVSQGLEQVSKMKDDVERQFDDAVATGNSNMEAIPDSYEEKKSIYEDDSSTSRQKDDGDGDDGDDDDDDRISDAIKEEIEVEEGEEKDVPAIITTSSSTTLTEKAAAPEKIIAKASPRINNQGGREIQRLKVQLTEKNKQVNGLLEEGQTLSKRVSLLEQKLKSIRKEKDDDEENVLELTNQVEGLTKDKKSLESVLTENEETTKERIEQLNEENIIMKKEVEDVRTKMMHMGDPRLLSSTIEHLEERVKRTESEATLRENALQGQLHDMRKRWQDATSRLDDMSQSVSESTQPLIRQIQAVQSNQRAQAEAHGATEKILTERCHEAEVLGKKQGTENQLLKSEVDTLSRQISSFQEEIKVYKGKHMQDRVSIVDGESKIADLKTEMSDYSFQLSNLQTKLKTSESEREKLMEGKRRELSEIERRKGSALDAAQLQEQNLQSEMRSLTLKISSLEKMNHVLEDRLLHSTSDGALVSSSDGVAANDVAAPDNEDSNHPLFLSNPGSLSVLELSTLKQQFHQKQGECISLQGRLLSLESSKHKVTEELYRVTNLNLKLQADHDSIITCRSQLKDLMRQNEILLELLGEKEEELDELKI